MTTRILQCLAIAFSLWVSMPTAFCSSGLTPPLEFGKPDERTWKVELRVKRDDVDHLTVARSIFRAGEPVRNEPVPVFYQAGVTKALDVAFEAYQGLPDGAYAEVLEAKGVPTNESEVGFVVTSTIYFAVENSRVRIVSQEEYSSLTQPVDTVVEGGAPKTILRGAGLELGARPAMSTDEVGRAIQLDSGDVPGAQPAVADESEKDE